MTVLVDIYGPDLNGAGQDIAQFHVHRHGCQHTKQYGPGRRYGGDPTPWCIAASDRVDVVCEIYPPDEFNYDPEDASFAIYENDIHFAPCLKHLPVQD